MVHGVFDRPLHRRRDRQARRHRDRRRAGDQSRGRAADLAGHLPHHRPVGRRHRRRLHPDQLRDLEVVERRQRAGQPPRSGADRRRSRRRQRRQPVGHHDRLIGERPLKRKGRSREAPPFFLWVLTLAARRLAP
ncbi:MAG: hypothetical protein EON87_12500 [Brevundimonas sp.]|nr:MAG: hypothetical protein EON87_12500 [Brevundimonas sp.]